MKKLITLLATATLAMSTVALADDANSNDVLKSAPSASSEKAVVADASGEKPEAMQMGEDAAAKSAGAEKPAAAKKHHHKKHHHHHHHHHAKKDAAKKETAENQTPTQETQPEAQTQQ